METYRLNELLSTFKPNPEVYPYTGPGGVSRDVVTGVAQVSEAQLRHVDLGSRRNVKEDSDR